MCLLRRGTRSGGRPEARRPARSGRLPLYGGRRRGAAGRRVIWRAAATSRGPPTTPLRRRRAPEDCPVGRCPVAPPQDEVCRHDDDDARHRHHHGPPRLDDLRLLLDDVLLTWRESTSDRRPVLRRRDAPRAGPLLALATLARPSGRRSRRGPGGRAHRRARASSYCASWPPPRGCSTEAAATVPERESWGRSTILAPSRLQQLRETLRSPVIRRAAGGR